MAADLHALEIEFAKNPSLEACLPLCAAYVAAKRYMEATVVCKKGIKNAAPTDPRGRIMLAHVTLAQGKAPKAQTELMAILAEFPNNPAALELLGRAHLEQGQRPEAIAALQAALAQDGSLQQAQALLLQLGVVQAPPPAAPPPAAPVPPTAMPAAAAPPPRPTPQPVPPPLAPSLAPPPAASVPPAAPPPAGQSVPPPAASASPDPAPAAPSAASRSHVGDFFAPTALGFSNEASGIETAGPGRLTILGFVPKATGSLRTTALVFVGIALLAGAFVAYQYTHSRQQKLIAQLFGQVRSALDEDRYGSYREALALGDKILAVDADHRLTLSAMAYTQAVLAFEHHEPGAQTKAQQLLARLKAQVGEENEFAVAARALVANLLNDDAAGLADVRAILQKGGSSPLVELEAFRLMNAVQPADKETKLQLRRVTSSVVNQARVLVNLGWYYVDQGDYAHATKYFEQTLQNVKSHPMAKLGRSLAALEQNIGLLERQKDIEADVQSVLTLPADALSQPVQAMALFVRSQLRLWQKNTAAAEQDFQGASKADPGNGLFAFFRGTALLRAGDAAAAAASLQTAAGDGNASLRRLSALADAQIRANQGAAARATLDRAEKLFSKDATLALLGAQLLAQQANWPAAIAAYQAIGQDAGGEAWVQAQQGIGHALLVTAPAQAVTHLEALLAKLPDSVSAQMQARLLCQLGQAYEATQNNAKAQQSYAFGIEKDRLVADCHFYQCRLMGRTPEAKQACKTYLTLDPQGRFAAQAAALAQ